MASLIVPPILTSPHDDAIQLYKAFKGVGKLKICVAQTLKNVRWVCIGFSKSSAIFMIRCRCNNILESLSGIANNNLLSVIPQVEFEEDDAFWSYSLPCAGRNVVFDRPLTQVKHIKISKKENIVVKKPYRDLVLVLNQSTLAGFGCDKAAVINIIAHRDATQRALIQQEYRSMYSEDLNKRLSKELSGNLENAVLLWMYDPAGRDATIVRKALSVDVVDPRAATEVICSRTPSQIQQFKLLYHSMFRFSLEHDIEFVAYDDHKKLLLAYVSTPRYEGPEVDRASVEHDAKALFKAGERKLGTDENTFMRIFSERSRAHLAAVSAAYHSMYGNSLKKAIKSETSGLFEFALLTILQCAENPAKYFAKELHKAMKGLGTDDTTLIRILVTRTEIDMQYIKAEYQKKHKKSLNDEVHSETSGDYRTFLLSLLGTAH